MFSCQYFHNSLVFEITDQNFCNVFIIFINVILYSDCSTSEMWPSPLSPSHSCVHVHTCIIGHYNPSVRIIDLVSHTTYVVYVNFIHKWRVCVHVQSLLCRHSLPKKFLKFEKTCPKKSIDQVIVL